MKQSSLESREGIRDKELLEVETWNKLSAKLKKVSFIDIPLPL